MFVHLFVKFSLDMKERIVVCERQSIKRETRLEATGITQAKDAAMALTVGGGGVARGGGQEYMNGELWGDEGDKISLLV